MPTGALPRQLQMWLMLALATVILTIIVFTGHSQAPTPRVPENTAAPASAQADRIRSYQERLTDEEARLRQANAEQQREQGPAIGATAPEVTPPPASSTADARRQREYDSLFADTVALSYRPRSDQPSRSVNRGGVTPRSASELDAVERSAGPAETARPAPQQIPAPIASEDSLQRLLEGTVIETVLLNRLDGTFAGPVTCQVTTPVYGHRRQQLVIPSGARVIGAVAPVQGWGETRVAITFHRLIMPDGRTYSLDGFKGLNQIGETGLKDQVNRHYAQIFGASLAIGAISGLAQYNTRGGVDAYTFGDASRQSAGASLAGSAGRVLDRYLNVLPTLTIREGHRIKVYLTSDLELPAYEDTQSDPGGAQ
jgi:type IV secretion system protein VirB10